MKRTYVLVACPPAEELCRGSRRDCLYVRAVLTDPALQDDLKRYVTWTPDREYLIMRAEKWDAE